MTKEQPTDSSAEPARPVAEQARRRGVWPVAKDVLLVATPLLTALVAYFQIYLKNQQDLVAQDQAKIKQQQELLNNAVQQEIDQRSTQAELAGDVLNRVVDYVDKSGLPPKTKSRIYVSLLQISTDVLLAPSGQLTDDQVNVVKKLPAYFALLSNNPDMLADVGATSEQIGLWAGFAQTSGDREVKTVALQALEQIVTTTGNSDSINAVIRALCDIPVGDDKKLRESLVKTVEAAFRRLNAPDLELEEQDKKRFVADLKCLDQELGDQQRAEEAAVLTPVLATAAGAYASVERGPAIPSGPDQPRQQLYDVRQQLSDVVNNLTAGPQAAAEPPEETVRSLVDQLDSGKRDERRTARSELGRIGQPAVPALVQILASPEASDQARLGAVTAMVVMDPSIALPAGNMGSVIRGLGDQNPTMRKNTALLLARLTNPTALDAAQAELFDLLDARASGDGVYNGVVVLGSWLEREDPAISDARKQVIRTKLSELRSALTAQEGWANTITLIGQYLS
jgi:hypothetical protein